MPIGIVTPESPNESCARLEREGREERVGAVIAGGATAGLLGVILGFIVGLPVAVGILAHRLTDILGAALRVPEWVRSLFIVVAALGVAVFAYHMAVVTGALGGPVIRPR